LSYAGDDVVVEDFRLSGSPAGLQRADRAEQIPTARTAKS